MLIDDVGSRSSSFWRVNTSKLFSKGFKSPINYGSLTTIHHKLPLNRRGNDWLQSLSQIHFNRNEAVGFDNQQISLETYVVTQLKSHLTYIGSINQLGSRWNLDAKIRKMFSSTTNTKSLHWSSLTPRNSFFKLILKTFKYSIKLISATRLHIQLLRHHLLEFLFYQSASDQSGKYFHTFVAYLTLSYRQENQRTSTISCLTINVHYVGNWSWNDNVQQLKVIVWSLEKPQNDLFSNARHSKKWSISISLLSWQLIE